MKIYDNLRIAIHDLWIMVDNEDDPTKKKKLQKKLWKLIDLKRDYIKHKRESDKNGK